MSWKPLSIMPLHRLPLDYGIEYDRPTDTVIGTEAQFIALQIKYPGETRNLQGCIQAIRCYLNNYGTDKQKAWGESRLRYLMRHVFALRSPSLKFHL
jgi:hypothetical protein